MTFSYSGDPSKSDVDNVRFSLGDTIEKDNVLSNEEIKFLLNQVDGNIVSATIEGCRKIKAHYAHLCDETVGRVRNTWSQKYKHFELLLDALIEADTRSNLRPYAGGISKSDKEVRENNQDRVEPAFKTDLHCYTDPPNNQDINKNNP